MTAPPEREPTIGPFDRRSAKPGAKPTRLRRAIDLLGRAATALAIVFFIFAIYSLGHQNARSNEIAKQGREVAARSREVAAQAKALSAQAKLLAEQEARDRREAVAANVRARRDDCRSSNRLRKALRKEAIQSQKTLPLLLELLPQLDTPEVRQLTERSQARQMRAYAPRDCEAYAREALP